MSNNPQVNDVPESITSVPSAPNIETRPEIPSIEIETVATVKKMKRENMLKILSLSLRWLSFVFSLIAFVVMVSNRHGVGINFEEYDEYRYVLAISSISTVYTVCQGIREVIQFVTKKHLFPQPAFAIIDFVADQILAFLLISAASVAVPLTNTGRKIDWSELGFTIIKKFFDMAAASISMAFLAFFTFTLSLSISGYNLFAHFFL